MSTLTYVASKHQMSEIIHDIIDGAALVLFLWYELWTALIYDKSARCIVIASGTCIVLTHNWHDTHMLFDGVDLLWTTAVNCHVSLTYIYLMLLNATHTIFLNTLLLLVIYWNICDKWISFSWNALASEILVLYGGKICYIISCRVWSDLSNIDIYIR